MEVFYFCHCCGSQLVKFDKVKCFEEDDFAEMENPHHIINVIYTETVFGMCLNCQIVCTHRCRTTSSIIYSFSVPRMNFKGPPDDKLTLKDIFSGGFINYMKTISKMPDVKFYFSIQPFSIGFKKNNYQM